VIKYLRIYRTIWRTFGLRLRPIGTFGLIQLRHLLDLGTRGLDHLIFPGFRRVPIDRPVFILGNPRSGTTFLHRFLLETEAFAAFALWELLFPAVSANKLLRGTIHRLASFSPARYHSAAAHETSLRDVETDELLTFFRYLEGPFLWSYFSAWQEGWESPLTRAVFDPEREAPAARERILGHMEACWRRSLYIKRKARVLAKGSTLALRIPTLLERYPGCRLIYMVRDPVETIPSGMSLVTGVLDRAYDALSTTPEEVRGRYLENLYRGSCHLFRHFHDAWRAGAIPEQSLRIVRYPDLMGDLERTLTELIAFCEIEPAPAFFDRLREQAARQRQHRSRHRYTPEQFGLTAERIREDLRFVYESYGLE
jgi:hypothetical protein